MMKKIIALIPFFLILWFFYLFITRKEECPTKIMRKKYVPIEIAGVVVKKYRDDKNRNLYSILIEQKDTVIRYPFDINLDYLFYQEVKQGDSVYKENGSLSFKIVTNENSKFYMSKCR